MAFELFVLSWFGKSEVWNSQKESLRDSEKKEDSHQEILLEKSASGRERIFPRLFWKPADVLVSSDLWNGV